jgi:MFS family permease
MRMPDRPLAEIKPHAPHDAAAPTTGTGAPQATAAAAAGSPKRATLTSAMRGNWHIARRTAVLAYAWMVICMTYYGISFALSSLGGSLAVSFMVSSIAELPSYLVAAWAIDRWGRHNTMGAAMLLGGAACAACAFVPAGGAQMSLASVGKFGIAGAFSVASPYTSELYPTVIRSAVLGVTNQAARVGGIVAPFIAMAGAARGSGLIPFLTFGAASLLGGLLIFTLPETLGAPLPDTMADMAVIASIFTNRTLEKKGFKAAAASMFKARVTLPGGGGCSRWGRGRGGAPDRSVWAADEGGPLPGAENAEEGLSPFIAAHRQRQPHPAPISEPSSRSCSSGGDEPSPTPLLPSGGVMSSR